MAQSKVQVVTFTAGERDSYELARIDRDDHASAAERLENAFLVEQGAAELAPGTKFLRATPGNGFAVLRDWTFNLDAAFCVEFSDELLRLILDDGYVTLTGAAATVGTFSDSSAVPSSGGDPAPDGGSGGPASPITAVASPATLSGTRFTANTTCSVTGGSGAYSFDWSNSSGTSVYASSPTSATTRFGADGADTATMVCFVTDLGSGATTTSNGVAVDITG